MKRTEPHNRRRTSGLIAIRLLERLDIPAVQLSAHEVWVLADRMVMEMKEKDLEYAGYLEDATTQMEQDGEDVEDFYLVYERARDIGREALRGLVTETSLLLSEVLGDPIRVWRAVALVDVPQAITATTPVLKTVTWGNVGIFWSWREASARAYNDGQFHGKSTVLCVLRGSVSPTAVDWEWTIRQNAHPMYGEDEKEIRLQPGVPVRIDGVRVGAGPWKTMRITATA